MRRVIDKRKKFKALSRGTIEFLYPENAKVFAFIRRYKEEVILGVINLSRFSQAVELNLPEFRGCMPEEVFSYNKFPKIRDSKYMLTLSPHSHFWLLLKKDAVAVKEKQKFQFNADKSWEEILEPSNIERFTRDILPDYLYKSRWFGGKSKTIQSIRIADDFSLKLQQDVIRMLSLDVKNTDGTNSIYLLPVTFGKNEAIAQLMKDSPQAVVTHIRVGNGEGAIYDAVYDRNFHHYLFALIASNKSIRQNAGQLTGSHGKKYKETELKRDLKVHSEVLRAEQSNTSIVFDNKYFLKIFRKLDEGVNPDTEIVKYLTEERRFNHVPSFVGSIELRRARKEPVVLSLMQECVMNEGNAWSFTFDQLKGFYDSVTSKKTRDNRPSQLPKSLLDVHINDIPLSVKEHIGSFYLEMIRLLGQRTAEMHLEFASGNDNPNFAPEKFSTLYQRSVFQSMRVLTNKVMQDLKKNKSKLVGKEKKYAESLVSNEKNIIGYLKKMTQKKFSAQKIRIHGDYHLGQVLFTGKDFVIIDFEGEPARPLSERRLKRSALRDLAGMIRSFHYAAYGALYLNTSVLHEHIQGLEPWAEQWYGYVSGVFLESYLKTIGNANIVPADKDDFEILLKIFLLEKAVYELGYELNNRPDWVAIPLKGIKNILAVTKLEKEAAL